MKEKARQMPQMQNFDSCSYRPHARSHTIAGGAWRGMRATTDGCRARMILSFLAFGGMENIDMSTVL